MNAVRFSQVMALVLVASSASAQAPLPISSTATVDAHNAERANYPVNPLTWSPELAAYAQDWANFLARTDPFPANPVPHRDNTFDNPLAPGQWAGENIYVADGLPATGPDAVQSWIAEKQWYNRAQDMGLGSYFPPGAGCTPPANKACGHFTQVIWKDTQYVGCGRAQAKDGSIYVVCNYFPGGNIRGQTPY